MGARLSLCAPQTMGCELEGLVVDGRSGARAKSVVHGCEGASMAMTRLELALSDAEL